MDQFEQRREKREQMRQKQLKEQKRMRRNLILAAIVATVCFVGIFLLARNARNNAPAAMPETPVAQSPARPQPQETTEPTSSRRKAPTTIHIKAAGDLNITKSVVESGLVASGYDFTRAFLDVSSLLSEADLTALNLEGNVCGAPYSGDSAPQQLLEALKSAGVDLIQLANSKAIHQGVSGLNATVRSVRAAGMAAVGAVAEGEEPGAYVIRYVGGVKVAVVAFTKGMDGMAMPVGSEKLVNLLYTDYASTYKKVDTNGITSLLRKVQSEEPDITIALLHWGSEYSDVHSATQDSIRKLMMKEGVDAIIGSHPHFVQEMDFDKENGTFVAYSLGDFFGDAARSGTAYSVVLELEITKDNTTGITKVTDFKYSPIYTVTDDTGMLRVLRLEEAINAYKTSQVGHVPEEIYNDMVYGLDRLEKRIHPEEEAG